MIWGCTTTSEVLLKTQLLPFVKKCFRTTKRCIIQDDSTPCHRAKKVRDFMKTEGVVQLTRSGNSPDLNQIENCWYLMSKRLIRHKLSSKQELINTIRKVWHEEINEKYLKTLIQFMPRRIKADIKVHG
ncbi:hypothetical protein ILUMI_16911 [Ignelater luminosus]|uniref:Tc1-like transposase DDE domain-containing protein n=1 Tax=Ignelater luminosus TaxID=2038154 RepID=A0A8K0CQ33_IGNLU|nr:hypothetical protein ILUMI_16911 [Ignelater luminosus]